ncbi:gamma-glutamylcyclotransferase [Streptomyces sp. AVP053U2]|uniref:gamma-glutamylcyclotransferase n=1 Tax=unclassified Streptomyces TaxID=2593676 RepID=UPI00083E0991|nr:gamma-glutamylcyclotransferase [Streptomyces sp. AVP053U2]ODA71504.1 AIG2-like family protein [Streptomyces sp. AVP053U2]
MSLYAAYAGNLDARLMSRRAPHSPLRATGWLNGWRLTFGGENWGPPWSGGPDGGLPAGAASGAGADIPQGGGNGALATIVEDHFAQVFVALYDITPVDEESLDRWEGTGLDIYRRTRVRVHTLDGEESAWTYVLNTYEGGLPSARYLGEVADAAESAGAPHDYVMELRKRPC